MKTAGTDRLNYVFFMFTPGLNGARQKRRFQTGGNQDNGGRYSLLFPVGGIFIMKLAILS
jgi:hypothetical protein